MYQTLAVAVLVLMLGAYLKSKIYFLENFVFRHLSLADCYSPSLPVSVIPPEWQNFHSMIFCAKYAWYFSLLP